MLPNKHCDLSGESTRLLILSHPDLEQMILTPPQQGMTWSESLFMRVPQMISYVWLVDPWRLAKFRTIDRRKDHWYAGARETSEFLRIASREKHGPSTIIDPNKLKRFRGKLSYNSRFEFDRIYLSWWPIPKTHSPWPHRWKVSYLDMLDGPVFPLSMIAWCYVFGVEYIYIYG